MKCYPRGAGVWCVASLLLFASSTSAQEQTSFSTFGGNEWWVEVYVDLADVDRVEVSVEDGAWTPLSLMGWGSWASSFYVPRDSRLVFRAHGAGGQIATSPVYLWPTGDVVQHADPAPEPEPEPDGFAASFSGVGGNNWWVEAYVDATQQVSAVEARVDQGAWRALSPTGWGSWATSFFVADDSLVELRATAASGATAHSPTYLWPNAALVSEPPPPAAETPPVPEDPLVDDEPVVEETTPTTTQPFEAHFSNPQGNNWWLEIDVASAAMIAAVHARVDGGAFSPLTQTDWGPWVGSLYAPNGSIVDFRATSVDGATVTSAAYLWPDATPTTPTTPPPAGSSGALAFDDERVRYVGRVDDRLAAEPVCSWTGCGFVFTTDATSVVLEVETNLYAGNADYLHVEIDAEPPLVVELTGGTERVVLASGLSGGAHVVRVQKRTEPQVGSLRFVSLGFEGGTLLDTATSNGPRILVIGDSITAGYGNVGDGPFCGFTAATEDGLQSYGAFIAQRFGGDAVITAFSGKGVYRNRDTSDPWVMPRLYDRLDALDDTSYAGFSPLDLVIVNLGTNDFAFSNPEERPFIDAYAAFVEDLRERFPSAPIVLVSGPMLTDEWPSGMFQRSTLRRHLEAVRADRALAGDRNVHFVEVEPTLPEEPFGCDYHPHVTTHARMAEVLTAAIADITGW